MMLKAGKGMVYLMSVLTEYLKSKNTPDSSGVFCPLPGSETIRNVEFI
ncbi:protein of unknown function [Limnospira indica PCC 8005]|uniref:Uncharacterized protein n=1 Tax=Limnospira indica PCC 8005 TaxID=376219 RepID=A0A9P1NYE0_9CYAN|nr:protein of unknown function [Limnospira indica PCC 8005]